MSHSDTIAESVNFIMESNKCERKKLAATIRNVLSTKELVDKFDQELTLAEEKERQNAEPDLSQFHHFNKSGDPSGVYHDAIFKYIKGRYNLFVCGGNVYIYGNGFYQADTSGAKLKTMIRELIYPQFVRASTVNNIFNLFLQDIELEKTFEELNAYPSYWINFKNGMYDCKSRNLLPHSPKYLSINQIPHSYDGSEKQGVKIDDYLNFICDSEDEKEMILQFVGYSMTKDTSQQKFLVLTGAGGSGKSTLIRLIEALIGKTNVSNVALGELSQRFASYGLMGKLVNSCADLEISALEDTSIIKKLLGEDIVRAEQKGRDSVFFNSYAKLIFSTNELPLVKSEKSNGFYRRLLVLTMDKIPLKKNPHLFQELETEIDYLLYLSVKAVERMYEQDLITESESSKQAVSQLWADSDTVQAFILDSCVEGADEKVERTYLFNKYQAFCEETERQSLTKNNFYKSLRVKGFHDFKTNGERFFKGISFSEKCLLGQKKTPFRDFKPIQEDEKEDTPFK